MQSYIITDEFVNPFGWCRKEPHYQRPNVENSVHNVMHMATQSAKKHSLPDLQLLLKANKNM